MPSVQPARAAMSSLRRAPAYLHFGAVDVDIRRTHCSHERKVHERISAQAEKARAFELALHVGQRTRRGHIAFYGMIHEVVIVHLDVFYLRRRHTRELFPRFYPYDHARRSSETVESALELHRKAVVIHGLHDEIEGVHFVPFHGVLRQIGHENEHHLSVHGAQLARSVHAAEHGHLYIHEHDIEIGRIFIEKIHGVRKTCTDVRTPRSSENLSMYARSVSASLPTSSTTAILGIRHTSPAARACRGKAACRRSGVFTIIYQNIRFVNIPDGKKRAGSPIRRKRQKKKRRCLRFLSI